MASTRIQYNLWSQPDSEFGHIVLAATVAPILGAPLLRPMGSMVSGGSVVVGLIAAGHDAAVDVENRAGDPTGVIRQQIRDGVGHVGRGADSSQRMKWRESV